MFATCLSPGVWPVWKAEASVSFFHFLFKLLDAVQKGHHGMVEFIVPEEPEATWAVERKFLEKHKTKGQNWSLEEGWNNSWGAQLKNSADLTLDLSVSDSKYEWFPYGTRRYLKREESFELYFLLNVEYIFKNVYIKPQLLQWFLKA